MGKQGKHKDGNKSSPFRFGMLGLFFSMATVWYSVLGKLSGMQFIVAAKLMKK